MIAAIGRWVFYVGVGVTFFGMLMMGGTPAASTWAEHMKAWAARCERAARVTR